MKGAFAHLSLLRLLFCDWPAPLPKRVSGFSSVEGVVAEELANSRLESKKMIRSFS